MNRERKCRVCGCTEELGCPGGCYWVDFDLCSQCADESSQVYSEEEEIDLRATLKLWKLTQKEMKKRPNWEEVQKMINGSLKWRGVWKELEKAETYKDIGTGMWNSIDIDLKAINTFYERLISNLIEIDSNLYETGEDDLKLIEGNIVEAIKKKDYEDDISFISVFSNKDFISDTLEDSSKSMWFLDYFRENKELAIDKDKSIRSSMLIDFLKSEYNLDGSNSDYLALEGIIVEVAF